MIKLSAEAISLIALLLWATATAWLRERWMVGVWEAGVILLTLVFLLRNMFTSRTLRVPISSGICLAICLLGLMQILLGRTVYAYATREVIVDWFVYAAVAYVACQLSRNPSHRNFLRGSFSWIAGGVAVLALFTIFRPSTRVFWLFATDSPEVIGPFISSNEYAQFAELALPVLWVGALGGNKRWLLYALGGALLVATVIGVRARMGSLLVLFETVLLLALTYRRSPTDKAEWRRVSLVLALLCGGLVAAVGTEGLLDRFWKEDILEGRDRIFTSSLPLIGEHWVSGNGLGSFPYVYRAREDGVLGSFVNHAHNDWLEAMIDGGIALSGLLLLLFLRLGYLAFRHPWAMGIPCICLHAFADFPLHRPCIMAWLFLLAGLLETASAMKSRMHRLH